MWAATSPELAGQGGHYCDDLEIAAPADFVPLAGGGVLPRVLDRFTAERLWVLSEKLLRDSV